MLKMQKRKKKEKEKKAQEEMVGFVLIIVLVMIIAVIFLGFSVRKTPKLQESAEIRNFLGASLLYTTQCKPSIESVYNLKDLIKACYKKEECLNGKDSCEELNKTLSKLIRESFEFGKEEKYKGYYLKINIENSTLFELTEGNTTKTE